VLSGDATLRSVQSKLQAQLTQTISNRYSSLGVMGQAGLNFNRDGSLTLDETKFRDALSNNFTAVAALFLGDGTADGKATASDSRVTYNTKTGETQAGTYDVSITSLAEQASATGAQAITALKAPETLFIQYGTVNLTVDLLEFDTPDMILSTINGAFSAQGIEAIATKDAENKIKIATTGYGSSQTFTIRSDQINEAGYTGFGTDEIIATGKDIEGTIGNHEATGNGLLLTGSEQPEQGLSLRIAQTQTGNYGTVTVAPASEGVEGSSILMNLASMLHGLTDSLSGPLHNAMDGLNNNITNLKDTMSNAEDRLTVRRQAITDEYNAANQALKMLQVNQSQLTASLASSS
jgi:flagellar hook-associated protein 2